MTPDPALIRGWEVVAADGFRCLKLDRGDAERWAAQCHGTIHPLGRLDGTQPDPKPSPEPPP